MVEGKHNEWDMKEVKQEKMELFRHKSRLGIYLHTEMCNIILSLFVGGYSAF